MGDTPFMNDLKVVEDFASVAKYGGIGDSAVDDDVIAAMIRVVQRARALERELVDMVNQHCLRKDDGSIFAGGLSANADAMLLLAEFGVLKITGGEGRCIYGEWDGWMKRTA